MIKSVTLLKLFTIPVILFYFFIPPGAVNLGCGMEFGELYLSTLILGFIPLFIVYYPAIGKSLNWMKSEQEKIQFSLKYSYILLPIYLLMLIFPRSIYQNVITGFATCGGWNSGRWEDMFEYPNPYDWFMFSFDASHFGIFTFAIILLLGFNAAQRRKQLEIS